jgi:hypothetical protein
MAMAQETISARVMIQVNWDLAEPLAKEVLEISKLAEPKSDNGHQNQTTNHHRVPPVRSVSR